ncbi:hypothetical protein [Solilutibacter silvestris]|uniref:hypothetical protein n=1 Tax=Solilutibacter silvestris TaxID=1645665 RepID=UPI003D33A56A
MTMNDDHDDFDRKARQLYQDATRETPQAVRQRLRAALAAPRPSRQAWQPVVAFASVAVLAIGGLWLQRPMVPAANTTPVATVASVAAPANVAPTVAITTNPAKKTAVSATAAYDNDPEFYAWLGNDAPPVPRE